MDARDRYTASGSSKPADVLTLPDLDALMKAPRYRFWADKEEATMSKYYGKVPTRELAMAMGRSISSVRNKADLMGLQHARS